MTSLHSEHPTHIRYIPGHAIFTIGLFLYFSLTMILDSILDYQEGTFTLPETRIILIFVIGMFGGTMIAFYLLLYGFLTVDARSGLHIFSRFSTIDARWDQIESITLRLNVNKQGGPTRGGLMMIFAVPYMHHTRAVKFRMTTKTGTVKTLYLRMNITKINQILAILTDLGVFQATRSEVDISRKKKKGNPANLREQWQFLPSHSTRGPTLPDFYIRDEQGVRWQKSYSRRAQIVIKVGWGAILSLFMVVSLFPAHISIEDNSLLWIVLSLIFGAFFCFGFILAWFTPEMRKNSIIQ